MKPVTKLAVTIQSQTNHHTELAFQFKSLSSALVREAFPGWVWLCEEGVSPFTRSCSSTFGLMQTRLEVILWCAGLSPAPS